MSEANRAAVEQLERVLGFFERIDGKSNFLFAINTGLLAVLCLNLVANDFVNCGLLVPIMGTVLFVGASIGFLLRATLPQLEGGEGSLIYFQEIAQKSQQIYVASFLAATEAERTRDLLSQVWRNSEILNTKFADVRLAFGLTAAALLPWSYFLAATSIIHGHMLAIK